MTDLFTDADARKREKQLEAALLHHRLLLTKALKLLKGSGIVENIVRREIKDTLKRSA